MSNTPRGKGHKRSTPFRQPQDRIHQDPEQEQTPEVSAWGSQTHNPNPTCLRIGFLNVRCLPTKHPHPKQEALKHHIQRHHLHILGLSEVGLNWSLVNTNHQWQERTFKQFPQISTTLSWNRNDIHTSTTQWGGTALISTGLITSRIHQKGTDPRHLGRWSRTTYQGQRNSLLTIYSIYRPTENHTGPLSVFQQQRTHLIKTHRHPNPLTIFDADLLQELRNRITDGEQLVVGGDINSDITDSTLPQKFHELGLIEAVLSHHPLQKPNFSTYIRNVSNKVIDGIWVTPSLIIQGGGYTDFGIWDHCTPWLDIDLLSTFGSNQPNNPLRTSGRRLQLSIPKTVQLYLNNLLPQIEHLHLLERARKLDATIQTTLTHSQINELELLDAQRTAAMLGAEKKCRKLRKGTIPFAPSTIQPALALSFWKLQLKRHRGKKVSSRLLERKRKQAQIPLQPFTSLTGDQIQQEISQCVIQWNKAKSQAITQRKEFLENKAQELLSSNMSKATALRQLLQQEKLRNQHRHIQHTIKGPRSTGLSSVYGVPDINGVRPHHTQPTAIAQCCIEANQQKYRRTECTPFMTQPLLSSVGFDGLNPTASSILNGTFPTTNLPSHTAHHIQELSAPQNLPPWPAHFLRITPAEHARAWRKAKERTSSSPSGLHFGLWKANAQHPTLCEMDSILRVIPFRTGYSMRRWQHGIDVELQKEQGNFNIERMRTIVLMEADHNLNNKLLGRRAMAHAERHQALAPEQYGSRKNHSSAQATVNNRLIYDLMRQTRHGGVICSNDAESCYDRIVHSVLSLSLQRLGVPFQPIKSMLTTIQKMEHKITGYLHNRTIKHRLNLHSKA